MNLKVNFISKVILSPNKRRKQKKVLSVIDNLIYELKQVKNLENTDFDSVKKYNNKYYTELKYDKENKSIDAFVLGPMDFGSFNNKFIYDNNEYMSHANWHGFYEKKDNVVEYHNLIFDRENILFDNQETQRNILLKQESEFIFCDDKLYQEVLLVYEKFNATGFTCYKTSQAYSFFINCKYEDFLSFPVNFEKILALKIFKECLEYLNSKINFRAKNIPSEDDYKNAFLFMDILQKNNFLKIDKESGLTFNKSTTVIFRDTEYNNVINFIINNKSMFENLENLDLFLNLKNKFNEQKTSLSLTHK